MKLNPEKRVKCVKVTLNKGLRGKYVQIMNELSAHHLDKQQSEAQ